MRKRDLEDLARFIGVPRREPRRETPRGVLKADFWKKQFQEVQERVEDWGYEVETSPRARDQVFLGESKTIVINSSRHPETRFYTLLHEVGHILIRRDWSRFSKSYPNYLDNPDARIDRRREGRKSYRIGLIAEEIEAWRRGRAWAERLGLYVDPLQYDTDANRSLMTYVQWTADVSTRHTQAARKAAAAKALGRAVCRTKK